MVRASNIRFESLEQRRLMSSGALDPTYGIGGKIASEVLGFVPNDIAVQKDGKIVAVGKMKGFFAVARVNADGTTDTTFGGGDGIVTTDFGGNEDDVANAVAVDEVEGKIVVVGHRGNYSRWQFNDQGQFAVARYNPDGSLDKTFDKDGKRTIDFDGWYGDEAFAVSINGDTITVAGTAGTGHFVPNHNFAIARLHWYDGSLASSFDGDGRLTTDMGSEDQVTAITKDPLGRIIAVGNSGTRFAVARYNNNGSMDKTFAGDGTAFMGFPGYVQVHDVKRTPDGKITVVGTAGGDFAMARFTAEGAPDDSFGAGTGRLTTDLGTARDIAFSVCVTPRNQILLSGYSQGQFALVRYFMNGALDASFGTGGKSITGFGGDESILTTELAADGKVIAYGRNTFGSVLAARYVETAPTISLLTTDGAASERGPAGGATVLVSRDAAYNFATRVFFWVDGTASSVKDYTSNLSFMQPTSMGIAGLLINGGIFGGNDLPRMAYIDIPAGASSVEVQMTPGADNVLEREETIGLTVIPQAAYSLEIGKATASASIAADSISINFQRASVPGTPTPSADLGNKFGDRGSGLTYGWDADNTANALNRGNGRSPDFRYDSLIEMQRNGANRKWEVAVPKGLYAVTLVAGDPNNADATYKMNLEGKPAISGTPSGNTRWFMSTLNVQVNDGRLTLTNAAGARNNRVCFIDIQAAAPGATAGAVKLNTPIRLENPPPAVLRAQTRAFGPLVRALISDAPTKEAILG
jgi:uncharacterized delta-60 repeat protein